MLPPPPRFLHLPASPTPPSHRVRTPIGSVAGCREGGSEEVGEGGKRAGGGGREVGEMGRGGRTWDVHKVIKKSVLVMRLFKMQMWFDCKAKQSKAKQTDKRFAHRTLTTKIG